MVAALSALPNGSIYPESTEALWICCISRCWSGTFDLQPLKMLHPAISMAGASHDGKWNDESWLSFAALLGAKECWTMSRRYISCVARKAFQLYLHLERLLVKPVVKGHHLMSRDKSSKICLPFLYPYNAYSEFIFTVDVHFHTGVLRWMHPLHQGPIDSILEQTILRYCIQNGSKWTVYNSSKLKASKSVTLSEEHFDNHKLITTTISSSTLPMDHPTQVPPFSMPTGGFT